MPGHAMPARPRQPPKETLTTLGWMKYLEDPSFEHFEWHYLKFLHECLTTKWFTIQFGFDGEALNLWYLVFKVLELDQKAQLDLMLLAQSGHIGRGHANKIMWQVGPRCHLRGPEPQGDQCSELGTKGL